MAIICGDIHGNVEKTKAFLAYKPEELHISLGDIVDSDIEPPSRQIECLKLLFDSGAVILWGNHDIQYANLLAYPCSGHIVNNPVPQVIKDNEHRFKAAHAVDGYLLTHAGVCTQISNGCTDPVELAKQFNSRLSVHRDLINCAWWREGNNRFTVDCDPIFNVSRHRGGRDDFSGIFWFDPFCEEGIDRGLRQIYGHCEIDTPPELDEFGHLNLNYFGRDICYLFDTKSEEIVRIEFHPMDNGLVEKQLDREVSRQISGSYYNINWDKNIQGDKHGLQY